MIKKSQAVGLQLAGDLPRANHLPATTNVGRIRESLLRWDPNTVKVFEKGSPNDGPVALMPTLKSWGVTTYNVGISVPMSSHLLPVLLVSEQLGKGNHENLR